MSLQINEDSYITVAEANEYVQNYFLENDPLRISWQSSSDNDKEIYLRKSCLLIDSLPFRGGKLNKNQTLAFPRRDGNMSKIKLAQAIQAANLTDIVQQEENNTRIQLQRAGVKSYSIGNLSETFGSVGKVSVSYDVLEILKDYLSGGYTICI